MVEVGGKEHTVQEEVAMVTKKDFIMEHLFHGRTGTTLTQTKAWLWKLKHTHIMQLIILLLTSKCDLLIVLEIIYPDMYSGCTCRFAFCRRMDYWPWWRPVLSERPSSSSRFDVPLWCGNLCLSWSSTGWLWFPIKPERGRKHCARATSVFWTVNHRHCLSDSSLCLVFSM